MSIELLNGTPSLRDHFLQRDKLHFEILLHLGPTDLILLAIHNENLPQILIKVRNDPQNKTLKEPDLSLVTSIEVSL